MRTPAGIFLGLSVAFAFALFSSCGSNGSDPVYDLRTLSEVIESLGSVSKGMVRSEKMKSRENALALPGKGRMRRSPGAPAQSSSSVTETSTYAYGENAHFYWTGATVKDDQGDIISTGTQTLDDDGFPVRRIWYYSDGSFDVAYDYTFDKGLFQVSSLVEYPEDPTQEADARKSYESFWGWNQAGVLVTRMDSEYDLNENKTSEDKWRSVMPKNALRGEGALGFWEFSRTYADGKLKYQSKVDFDSDGYPQTFSKDSNGDGTYDLTYQYKTTKTDEGYLESVIFEGDGVIYDSWKYTLDYDTEGLLKTWKKYSASGDEFVLDIIYTFVWYKNPVGGPTGGLSVYFESDENGNPVSEYETIEWTETQRINHYYSSPGEETTRRTYFLEKIMIPGKTV
jgi:hypothetical protein